MTSIDAAPPSVETHVTLYRIARIRAAQALIPFVVVASIFARRSLGPVAVTTAFLLQLATLVTFLSARRGLGWQPFRLENGAGSFGPNLRLAQTRVERWTIMVAWRDCTVRMLACGYEVAPPMHSARPAACGLGSERPYSSNDEGLREHVASQRQSPRVA